jgi:hypothetical protein
MPSYISFWHVHHATWEHGSQPAMGREDSLCMKAHDCSPHFLTYPFHIELSSLFPILLRLFCKPSTFLRKIPEECSLRMTQAFSNLRCTQRLFSPIENSQNELQASITIYAFSLKTVESETSRMRFTLNEPDK